MNFIKTPVKGTNDFLPGDMKLRQKVFSVIRQTYAAFGFSEIETPAMEHIENLTSNQGGENEKLIFRILKRGAELERAMEKGDNLADSGLRYDLTLPLSRFYAANSAMLSSPFKALQIGPVWRADRPQKGRFRQFTQCDIDILGDASLLAEVELVTATATALTRIFAPVGIEGFTVHLGDRRILKGLARWAGFSEEETGNVFIALDKLDKIGLNGVREELLSLGLAASSVERCLSLFENPETDCRKFCALLGEENVDPAVAENLHQILSLAAAQLPGSVKLVFDPTLVRGMGYYTGTIFEIRMDAYSFAIAGGGRYDEMIGKFSGQSVPACGFSIGFERIITVLRDAEKENPEAGEEKTAILIETGVAAEKLSEIFLRAAKLREEGKTVTVLPMKKNAKFQIDRLTEEGYTSFEKIWKD